MEALIETLVWMFKLENTNRRRPLNFDNLKHSLLKKKSFSYLFHIFLTIAGSIIRFGTLKQGDMFYQPEVPKDSQASYIFTFPWSTCLVNIEF